MPLATINSIPKTPEDLAMWSFAHAVNHRDIVRRIMETKGQNLPEYVLDPLNPNDMDQWNLLHFQMHQDMDSALNIQLSNLSEVDWKSPESVAIFVLNNFEDHFQASAILGIE